MEQTSITTAAVDLYAHVLNARLNSNKKQQENSAGNSIHCNTITTQFTSNTAA